MADEFLRIGGRFVDTSGNSVAKAIRTDKDGFLLAKTVTEIYQDHSPQAINAAATFTLNLKNLQCKELIVNIRQHGVGGSWKVSALAKNTDLQVRGGLPISVVPMELNTVGSEYGVGHLILPVLWSNMDILFYNDTGFARSSTFTILGRF